LSISQSSPISFLEILQTFTAMTAAIANQPAAAGLAMRPIIGGPITVLCWNRQTNIVAQVKFHGPAYKIQACLKGLLRLLLL